MDGSHAVPVFRNLKVKVTLFLAVLVMGLLALNWMAFQHVRTLLFHNLEERGIWSARNLAHDAWTAMENQDFQELNTRSSALLLQDDVVHVGMTANDGNLLLSLSSPSERQATVLPEFPRHSCDSERPLLRDATLFDKQVMIISVPVRPIRLSADPSTSDDMDGPAPCAGTLHLSMALEGVDRRLSGMLLTFGLLCMYVLGIGMAGYLFAFKQYIRPLSQLNRSVQEVLHADFHAEPVSLISSTSDDVGGLITTVSAFLKQVRQRMEHVREICTQLSAICHETVATANDVVTACQGQSASGSHLSSDIEAGLEVFEAITEDSEQLVYSTEEALESTRKIEQMLNQSTSNLEDAYGQTSRNSERMGLLREKVSQIDTVVKTIHAIADQTRMIAFNASIEAAGAGESGGRFSIVAAEVRRLANTVVEALEEIKELVASVQVSTSELSLASETGIREVNQALAAIRETTTTVRGMRGKIETNARKIQHIGQRIQQQEHRQTLRKHLTVLTDTAQEAVSVSTQALNLSHQIQQLAENLTTMVSHHMTDD